MFKGVVFDLDDTLVDTAAVRPFRDAGRWKQAVAHLDKTRLFEGVGALMHKLRERRLPWAIVTTSVSFYANKVIEYHCLSGGVCIAFHDATPKPSPAPVLLALRRMLLRPDDVIAIGDAEADLLAYRAAGVRSIGAGWSPRLHTGPWDTIAESPADILLAGD